LADGIGGEGPVAAGRTKAVSSVVVVCGVVASPIALIVANKAEHALAFFLTVPLVKQTLLRVTVQVTHAVSQLGLSAACGAVPAVELVIETAKVVAVLVADAVS